LSAALFSGLAAQAQETLMLKESREDLEALARLLYERMNDPTFRGEVRFIRSVPLISSTPDIRSSSQYYTSLILHARHVTEALFHGQVNQLFVKALQADSQAQGVGTRFRMQAATRVLEEVFGRGDELTPDVTGVRENDHPNDERRHHHQHYASTAVGFKPTRLEQTTGLHALKTIDERLRRGGEPHAELINAIGTKGVEWRIYDHEAVDADQCKRFIARSIPFVTHRDRGALLVCGYATYEGTTYLMAFDLATIERRVSLGTGGGGGMTYSEYRELEKQVRDRDPIVELDPLFWDYKSYFSVKNLACFRLTPVRSSETVTAIYPAKLREPEVSALISVELDRAKREHEGMIEERLARKRAQLQREAEPQKEEEPER